jgi:outer membrane receptor for ferrienterochelin and colicins
VLLAPSGLQAQLQDSPISGRVFDPSGRPVRDAKVVLLDGVGQAIFTVLSGDEGRFRVPTVPPGRYQVRAETPSLRSASHRIAVAHGLPVEIDLHLSPRLSENVTVSPDPEHSGMGGGTTLAGETVRRTTAPLRMNALRAAIAGTPGWTSEDNGLVHFRGADDGILFVVDGIPIYERLDPQFGAGFDPLTAGSVRILSGHVPPEHGLRSGGVIEVRSRGGTVDVWSGAFEAGLASHDTEALGGLVQGPITRRASVTVSGGREGSRRFLDPVRLDNLHNEGATGHGEGEFAWASGGNALTLRAGHARASFDVPNDAAQQEAGQDQRQRLRQSFGTINWRRSWSAATVSQLALFGRRTEGRLLGSAFDIPISAEAHRRQGRMGVLAALAHKRKGHDLKVGFEASRVRLEERFCFFVTDAGHGEEADLGEGALAHDTANPFNFTGDVDRPIHSFYVQDSWRVAHALVVELGFRYDRSRLLLTESQWSPRLGVSYAAGRVTVRASLNRFFQPPQTEYLLLSSSPRARQLSPFVDDPGTGGADIRAERQTAVEAGAEFLLRGFRADAAIWRRWIRHQGDPNVFFGTAIVFPNSVDRGRAKGLDLRLESPRRAGVSGFLTYTLAKIDQYGPINGGLFLEDDIIDIGAGTRFTPDHDQRHALSAGLSYEAGRRGLLLAFAGRYRSGTPLEVGEEELRPLAGRHGGDLVDVARERVKPYVVLDVQAGCRLVRRRGIEVSIRGAVLNLTGTRYAFNFGNPFSGTHFGPPRTVRVDLRLERH